MLAWAVGGLWALCGAMSLGELGAMLPRSGGDYAFLHRAYGRGTAFIYGWLSMLVTFPGSLAVMATLTWRYQGSALGGPALGSAWWSHDLLGLDWRFGPAELGAALTILALTWLNHRSTRGSAWGQLGITAGLLVFLVVGAAGISTFAQPAGTSPAALEPRSWGIGALALALLPIYFAYAGWNGAAFIAGELRQPGRTLPRALLIGTAAVTGLYLVMALAYSRAVPVSEMPALPNVGAAAARALLGERAGTAVDALIAVAVLGSLNATILAGSRVLYAMAGDGLFLSSFAGLHPRHRTPSWSLWGLAIWAVLLVLAGQVEPVLDATVGAMIAMGALVVLAVPLLRHREPHLARPFRVPLYPLPPLIFVVISGVVLIASLRAASPWATLGGAGLTLFGLLVYWLGPRRLARSAVQRGGSRP